MHARRLSLFRGLVAGCLSLVMRGPAAAQITATPRPPTHALTRGASNVRQILPPDVQSDDGLYHAAISYDGSAIVFNDKVNVFEVTTEDLARHALTNVTSGQCEFPRPNRDGSAVVMACSANVTGQNADGNLEIVLLRNNEFVPITNSTVTGAVIVDNEVPTIASDGKSIAFVSNGNYTGQNPDGRYQVFLWRDGKPLTQVTKGTTAQVGFLNEDGRFILFAEYYVKDTCPVDGSVYRYDLHTGQTVSLFLPAESSRCGPCGRQLGVGLSGDATVRVFTAFTSCDADDIAHGRKLFRQRIGDDPTFLLDVPDFWDVKIAVNGDGSRIAVLQGDNSGSGDEWESVLFTSSGRQDLPGVPRYAGDLAFDGPGRHLIFISNEDLTGENPDHLSELFVAAIPLGSDTPLPTATATATPSPTRSTPIIPTPRRTVGFCAGDCDNSGQVTVDELVIGVNIALGIAPLGACMNLSFDCNATGEVTVDCLVIAVNNALYDCGVAAPTRGPTRNAIAHRHAVTRRTATQLPTATTTPGPLRQEPRYPLRGHRP